MLERKTAKSRLGKQIRDYIRDRAKVEGMDYGLALHFFIEAVDLFREVFGVQHDGEKMIRDRYEPCPGYFQEWMARKGNQSN